MKKRIRWLAGIAACCLLCGVLFSCTPSHDPTPYWNELSDPAVDPQENVKLLSETVEMDFRTEGNVTVKADYEVFCDGEATTVDIGLPLLADEQTTAEYACMVRLDDRVLEGARDVMYTDGRHESLNQYVDCSLSGLKEKFSAQNEGMGEGWQSGIWYTVMGADDSPCVKAVFPSDATVIYWGGSDRQLSYDGKNKTLTFQSTLHDPLYLFLPDGEAEFFGHWVQTNQTADLEEVLRFYCKGEREANYPSFARRFPGDFEGSVCNLDDEYDYMLSCKQLTLTTYELPLQTGFNRLTVVYEVPYRMSNGFTEVTYRISPIFGWAESFPFFLKIKAPKQYRVKCDKSLMQEMYGDESFQYCEASFMAGSSDSAVMLHLRTDTVASEPSDGEGTNESVDGLVIVFVILLLVTLGVAAVPILIIGVGMAHINKKLRGGK